MPFHSVSPHLDSRSESFQSRLCSGASVSQRSEDTDRATDLDQHLSIEGAIEGLMLQLRVEQLETQDIISRSHVGTVYRGAFSTPPVTFCHILPFLTKYRLGHPEKYSFL